MVSVHLSEDPWTRPAPGRPPGPGHDGDNRPSRDAEGPLQGLGVTWEQVHSDLQRQLLACGHPSGVSQHLGARNPPLPEGAQGGLSRVGSCRGLPPRPRSRGRSSTDLCRQSGPGGASPQTCALQPGWWRGHPEALTEVLVSAQQVSPCPGGSPLSRTLPRLGDLWGAENLPLHHLPGSCLLPAALQEPGGIGVMGLGEKKAPKPLTAWRGGDPPDSHWGGSTRLGSRPPGKDAPCPPCPLSPHRNPPPPPLSPASPSAVFKPAQEGQPRPAESQASPTAVFPGPSPGGGPCSQQCRGPQSHPVPALVPFAVSPPPPAPSAAPPVATSMWPA
ncbi:basic proline-rich protein-like [Choloepus didactylus]|uniref:basic proline-rich protein-like n=1 Tax=Choloepus didactylus TaxID=27675 RepID=UPI00189F70C2|nr:basic proline-rich protein-like [Choloepus didactylus]XP_037704687.1 basic proline-rich protein-like [Choloepus didactylus]XP_037704688.1 basic proline-rich protein-like [Choloepus didactylus]XP_037704689.1 basic proline-rich protein-like [Choloepus didactylus]XP_037704690.1 basic proline-rich protein-like [Choloepus didactylus]XP_037704692.1 basic proline-rich protein-like [Choloepus didactylus]XP_037704693.1 basic proline-rich protein-like [Choloepus didactylus]XP_037704694.1 basic prol